MTLSRGAGFPADFDSLYYLENYPDVSSNMADPLRHYLEFGRDEGRYGSQSLRDASEPIKNGKRVLFADKRLLEYDRSAGERASFFIIMTFLKLGYEVAYLPLECREYQRKYLDAFLRLGVEAPVPPADKAADWTPIPWLKKNAPLFDLFYLVRLEVAECMLEVIRNKAPHAPILYHAPDLGWLREGREALLTNNLELAQAANALKKRELAIMRAARAAVVVSDEEKRLLLDEAPRLKAISFPVLYSEVAKDVPSFWDRRDFVFIGGGRHRPNTDACLWFAHEIWPHILQKLPLARFHIVGAYQQPEVMALNGRDNIVVDGFIEDLDVFMAKTRVSVAPLRFGAGIKGKVGMSLGLGLPCVCTGMAAEGMRLKNGDGVALAENARDFAEACVAFYTDAKLWEEMSIAGRKHIETYFGVEANDAQFTRALHDLGLLPEISWFSEAPFPSFRRLAPPSAKPRASVIISAGAAHMSDIKACLRSIALHGGSDYEVLLVHGGNEPPEEIQRQFPEIRLICRNGCAFAQHISGALNARGRELVFSDAKTRFLPGFMERLRQASDNSSGAVLVGRLDNQSGQSEAGSTRLAFIPHNVWKAISHELYGNAYADLIDCLEQCHIAAAFLDSKNIAALRGGKARQDAKGDAITQSCPQYASGEKIHLAYMLPANSSFWQRVASSRQAAFQPAGLELDIVPAGDQSRLPACHALILPEPLIGDQDADWRSGLPVIHDLAVLASASLSIADSRAGITLVGALARQMELRALSRQPEKIICLPAAHKMATAADCPVRGVGVMALAPDAARWACALIYGLRMLAPARPLPFEINILADDKALATCNSRFEKRMLAQARLFSAATGGEFEKFLAEQDCIAAPFEDHAGVFAASLAGIPAIFAAWNANFEDSWREVAKDLHALADGQSSAARLSAAAQGHEALATAAARLGAEQLREMLAHCLLNRAGNV